MLGGDGNIDSDNSFKGLFLPFPFLSKVGKKEFACLIKLVLKRKIFVVGCLF